jgi:hypothetical protein
MSLKHFVLSRSPGSTWRTRAHMAFPPSSKRLLTKPRSSATRNGEPCNCREVVPSTQNRDVSRSRADRRCRQRSAARRKGKWTGGNPVLGYDIDPQGGRLVVNPAEAERVREIFRICAGCTTLAAAQREVNARGLATKDWINKSGKHHQASRRYQ